MKTFGAPLILVFGSLYCWLSVLLPWSLLEGGRGDFHNYYEAARSLVNGLSPYGVHGFDYPPLLAFLLAAPATQGELEARALWFVISQACLLASAFVTARWLGGDRAAWLAVVSVWALGGTLAENLFLGQVNPLLLLLIVAAFYFWDRRPHLAAALIGVAAALKLWPGGLFLPLLTGRRWSVLAAGVGVSVLLTAGPLIALSLAWPPPHLPTSSLYWMGNPAPLNYSAPAVALRMMDPPRGRGPLPEAWLTGNDPSQYEPSRREGLLALGVSILVLGLGIVAVLTGWRTRIRDGGGDAFRLPALLAVLLVASPISWYHYQILQLPGLAVIAAALLRRSSRGGLAILAVVGFGLTWSQRFAFGAYVDRFGWTSSSPFWLWTSTSLVPVLGLVLVGWLVREALRAERNLRALDEGL